MLNKCKWISFFLAVLLMAATAQADLITINGNFEADASLVPNAGDTAAAAPTGWKYDYDDDYYVDPELINISNVGDGSGGTVGVKFPNWKPQKGWQSAITQFVGPVTVGHYTFSTTFTALDLINPRDLNNNRSRANENWLYTNLYATDDPNDPWSDYDKLAEIGWVQLTDSDNGVWQTRTVEFDILDGDSRIGDYFAPWFEVENYFGNIILGEMSLVRTQPTPEPATMLLFGVGLMGLAGFRKKFKK